MATGISDEGRRAEESFRELTGAARCAKPADGDAIVGGHHVEVKKASTTTVNQVRAVKYLTLVVLSTKDECWYVVPPHEVVRLCAERPRGQHTENPLESVTLSTNRMARFRVDNPNDLAAVVRRCAEEGERHEAVKRTMADIHEKCVALAAKARKRAIGALS